MTDQVAELKAGYIRKILELQGDMTGQVYAAKLGIDPSRLSRLKGGHLYGFNLELIMRMVLRAGGDLFEHGEKL